MGKGRFENLDVFKEGRILVNRIYEITKNDGFKHDYNFVRQLRSAALSIISNIGEGHEKDYDAEYARFLTIAKGSCGEVRAQVLIAMDQGHITNDVYDELYDLCTKVAIMLNKMIKYLRK